MAILIIIVPAVILALLDIAALRWGADSRYGFETIARRSVGWASGSARPATPADGVRPRVATSTSSRADMPRAGGISALLHAPLKGFRDRQPGASSAAVRSTVVVTTFRMATVLLAPGSSSTGQRKASALPW